MPGSFEELVAFEQDVDAKFEKLTLRGLPLRSVLSSLYIAADAKLVGGRFKKRKGQRDVEVGTAIVSRISYIIRALEECTDQIGLDIDDVLSVFDEQNAVEINQLLGYAHFCEIMPLVRRKFLSVERQQDDFVLSHPDEVFKVYEENDILMSEISLPHLKSAAPYPIENCVQLQKDWPYVRADLLIEVLSEAFGHYTREVFELPLLSDEGFSKSFGFSRNQFLKVRAALMAYCDFCLGMADAAEGLFLRAFTKPRRNRFHKETLEWVAPFLDRNHIIGTVAGLSAVEVAVAEKIVELFTIEHGAVTKSPAGEGFLPPFFRIGNGLLFSPHAVKLMLAERNLLYSILRTDQSRFDNVVSNELEPSLLVEAESILARIPDVQIRKNVDWRRGEIDLLAYHEASNSALQLQAKAGVAPQGARMVAQVEARTLEAVQQIERFIDLEVSERDAICSKAFDKKLSNVVWYSGVIVRTCLGTQKAWAALGETIPLNPVLLSGAVKKTVATDKFSFDYLVTVARGELLSLRSDAVQQWENRDLKLFGKIVRIPLLDLNYAAISKFRENALN